GTRSGDRAVQHGYGGSCICPGESGTRPCYGADSLQQQHLAGRGTERRSGAPAQRHSGRAPGRRRAASTTASTAVVVVNEHEVDTCMPILRTALCTMKLVLLI